MPQTTQPAPLITTDQIWSWLHTIPDPEIPVISITDLGIVRSVNLAPDENTHCTITITPTYSGCPATEVISTQIRQTLAQHGLIDIDLRLQLSPPWTTDWLTETARQNLRTYGIAPPHQALTQITPAQLTPNSLLTLSSRPEARSAAAERSAFLPPASPQPPCPLCGSTNTELLSQFSSTPCKSIHRCLTCREPFDHFKPH